MKYKIHNILNLDLTDKAAVQKANVKNKAKHNK